MADWLALDEVAARAWPGRPFMVVSQEARDHAHFHLEVAHWQASFRARAGDTWALHFDDAARFAAALYGAWHAGKHRSAIIAMGDIVGMGAVACAHVALHIHAARDESLTQGPCCIMRRIVDP